MKVEKRGGFSDKVSCLAGFFGGFLAHVKCLWSEGAKLLAHGSESFGKIFDRFAVNFQRVGVNCNSFWSQKIKGSLENHDFYIPLKNLKKYNFHFSYDILFQLSQP